MVSTERNAKANVQTGSATNGPASRESVKTRVKLSKPTPTRQPGVRTSPSSDTKLPESDGVYVSPVAESVKVSVASS